MIPENLPRSDSADTSPPDNDDLTAVRPSEQSEDAPPTPPGKRNRLKGLAKKTLFAFLTTVFVLVMIEVLLAAFGVKPVFYEDPFMGFASHNPLFQKVTKEDGETVYQTSPGKLEWFNEQSFPTPKPEGTFRIFCLGGSTTVGRPYDDRTSFAGWLREFAKEADPGKNCEVINAGGVSYASYRVAHLMEELVQYEPDFFIVYTGHNEFLERHTYRSTLDVPRSVRNLSSLLSRTRIYSLMHRVVHGSSQDSASRSNNDKAILPGEVDAVLDHTLGPESYKRDDKFRSQVISHYTNTLHRIVEIARHAGAEVLFVEPASNLRDCRPFKSQHRAGLLREELLRWNQLVEAGREAARSDNLRQALNLFDRALQIDERYAELHFERGRVLWKLERFDEAKTAFVKARDEDVCPLRALTPMRQILRDVASERKVRLIPFATVVDSRSPHGVPGSEMFLDHVHPTIEGHRLLADLIVDELDDMNVIHSTSAWTETARQKVIERVESTLDRRDRALALRNLAKVLTWAGKFEEADRLALKAVADLPDDYDTLFLAGNAEVRRQNHRDAIAYFEKTVQLNPNHVKAYNNIGNEYFQLGELEKAEEYFELAVQVDPSFSTGFHNLGVVHFESGDVRLAIQYLNKALALETNRFDSHWLMSKIHFHEKRYKEAKYHMQKAVAIRPDDLAAQEDLKMLTELNR